MVKQLNRKEWRQRRRQFPRVYAELTQEENLRLTQRLKDLGQSKATYIRRLIAKDLESPSQN
jgi:predicted DNA-binding protein